MLRARLRGGILNKARRGELRCGLPAGLIYDACGGVVLDPDQQVQETVPLLFQTFARTGTLRGTIKYFRQQGLLFPKRTAASPQKGQLVWVPLSLGRACAAIHNPSYAGPALLQGRVVCGLCGARMHVHYTIRRNSILMTNYVCAGRHRLFGDPLCQSILGTGVDAAVGKSPSVLRR